MAAGDVTMFEEFLADLSSEVHNLASGGDTVKLGLIDNTGGAPAANTASPRWGNFSGDQVPDGNGYTNNGETIGSANAAEAAGTLTFDGNNVSLTQNASGFTNARWGIIYNETAANDEAIAFVDLGEDLSLQDGDININWNASGIFTIAPA